ncbi:tetratricopeptide repeat protein, partial [Candidatus Fermentibacteria bacterium]|nr:tetratricopeptide repeat protein [Candidatus Fermentibacteria bacterium]
RSLVWSLGALLCEMLSGQAPTAEDAQSGPGTSPPRQMPLPPRIPERIRLLIYRMMEPDPELRIQSLEAVRHDLEAAKIPPVPQGPLPEERRFADAPGMELPPGETLLGDSNAVPFVGREREVSALIGLLADPQVRLITLVGPGGIGKSRLAVETAQRVTERFSDGVFVVPLSEVRSPAFIPLAIANALGLSFGPGDRLDVQVQRYLRGKAALLVLDDLDRVVDGAGQIGDLVRETTLMKIIGTCRERLRLRLERMFDVGGLEVPAEEETRSLLSFDSVRLFRESAQRVCPAYALTAEEEPVVAQICRALEGVPLAIELAAGWVRVLPVRGILKEVMGGMETLTSTDRDVAPRHTSMAATFQRSWMMLSEQERLVLLRFSVFRGGFDRDAAQAVAGATLPVLASLVDKSLIGRDVFGRFRMHGLLRQYVQKRLAQDADGNHAAKRAHSRYYGSFMQSRGPLLRSPRMASAYEEIARERANVDSGFEWSLHHDDLDRLKFYIEPLSRYFQHRSQFQEGEQLFTRGLHVLTERFPNPPILPSPEERMTLAQIKTCLALNKGRLGYYTEARNLLADSLAVFEHLGTARDSAFCLRIMANLAGAQGHYREALGLFDRALSVLQESGETEMQGIILSQMAGVVLTLGEIERAQNLRESARAMLEKAGDPIPLAQTLNGLGDIALHRGNRRQAQEYYERAFSIIQETGHEGVLCVTIDRLAIVARSRGDYHKAKCLNEEVLRRHRETGSLSGIARGLYVLGNCLVYLEELGRSRELLVESVDLYHSIGERSGEASALCSLGDTCREMKDWESAKTAYVRSLLLLRQVSAPEMIVLALTGLARCNAELKDLDAARSAFGEALATYRRFSVASRLSSILLSASSLLKIQSQLRDALIINSFLARYETAEENHRECAREEITRLSPLLEPVDLQGALREAEEMDSSAIVEFVTQLLA